MNTVLSIVLFILFLFIVSNKKIPNSMLFMVMAPLMVLTGMMDASSVWELFSNTGIWLVMIIGVFAHLMDISGFDEVIGNTFYKMTQPIKGKYRDLGIYAIIFIITALCSTLMSNVSVALAMVPAIYGISKKTGISRSKMVLFIIYAATLGGASTLIGTDTNIFANSALEEAGIQPFAMFDFAWVGVPTAILSGIYMVICNRWCKSYDDVVEDSPDKKDFSEEEKRVRARQRKGVSIAFLVFVLGLVLNSFSIVKVIFPYFNAYIIGFLMLSGLWMLKFFDWKTLEKGFKVDYLFTTVGLLAVAKMISNSSIGDLITNVLGNTLSGNTNPYFIQTVFFVMTVIVTQFMNNMTACGVIAPIAIALAHSMGADPRAFVMAIAIGAGCGYLTPFASGTNQRMSVFSECTLVDYMRFGWPLIVINYACSILILPRIFPFF